MLERDRQELIRLLADLERSVGALQAHCAYAKLPSFARAWLPKIIGNMSAALRPFPGQSVATIHVAIRPPVRHADPAGPDFRERQIPVGDR